MNVGGYILSLYVGLDLVGNKRFFVAMKYLFLYLDQNVYAPSYNFAFTSVLLSR